MGRDPTLCSPVYTMGTTIKFAFEDRARRVPDRGLTIRYFTFAHVCLLAAFGLMVMWPRAIGGFYYHPRLVAVVHLTTLGWISSSILGALYMITPMALRAPLEGTRLDRWAFWAYALGTVGMVSHFWLDAPSGMLWAAALVVLAFARVSWVVWIRVSAAPLPGEIKAHFRLAFLNLGLAATLGILVGIDKIRQILPGFVLDSVLAHAHLAALGWAMMMVMAAGYRLLPMILPAAMPSGPWVWATAVVMETGVLGLTASLLIGSRWIALFAGLCVAGVALFLGRVRWMLRNRRPAPRALKKPDVGVLHVASALFWMLAATVLGLWIVLSPPSEWKIQVALAYGALGLVGFLAQMVVGVALRMVPLLAWLASFADTAFQEPPRSPHEMPIRWLQWAIFGLWTVGVPGLAASLAFNLPVALRGASSCLFAAVLLGGVQQFAVLRRAGTPLPDPPETG